MFYVNIVSKSDETPPSEIPDQKNMMSIRCLTEWVPHVRALAPCVPAVRLRTVRSQLRPLQHAAAFFGSSTQTQGVELDKACGVFLVVGTGIVFEGSDGFVEQ